ncbi:MULTISPECIES: aminotransferase class V-fold PLP-dependent enzyme [Maribacter]|uniref:Aminotransferase class V-fold PLP-dependent enzyme n=1 Tax=Maribacter flavus TaxID=1658664 RepID=A0ABU7IIS0_9FLAO|nr:MULTISPECIES: aminotransferase class V-fold PLP-dependent enzyme [Maribacter]MDC6405659.1 aminotransferase class V-fold PLP-dependent enzyme [Maribacter sp. PR66]MEE1972573.1 aminotransferase class V-fold PLP-dependent enzyme [Maribacter flavus]
MSHRRKFLKQGALALLSAPLLSFDPKKEWSLGALKTDSYDDAYWNSVRKQFPLKEGQTYFNNGTMGPTPGYVLDKMMHHMLHYNVEAATIDYKNNSGPKLLSGYFPYEELRTKLANIIKCDFREISLIQNATFGMNYVGMGLDLKPGDELLNTNQEHGGGFGAWQLLAKRKGCVYKQAILPEPANDPQEIVDAIFKQVTKKTKVIAIPHIVSGYGTVMPVKEICQKAKNNGIFTVLDGAQCVGQIPVDVRDIGCDAYYSSLHKWLLAPAGSGLLYINKDVVSNIWSTIASYNWDNQEDHGFRLMQNGTGNAGLLAGYDAAVDFFNTIGAEQWLGRIKELGMYLRNGLKRISHVTIYSSTNEEMAAGITTYGVAGISGPDLQTAMWEKERLQPRSVGDKMIRHSVHIYNSKEEIDRSLRVIESLG